MSSVGAEKQLCSHCCLPTEIGMVAYFPGLTLIFKLQFSHPLPESDEDEDYIDTGAAILNFYCTLVDLLGRCAPDAAVIALVS